jgi:hypothetical protein
MILRKVISWCSRASLVFCYVVVFLAAVRMKACLAAAAAATVVGSSTESRFTIVENIMHSIFTCCSRRRWLYILRTPFILAILHQV